MTPRDRRYCDRCEQETLHHGDLCRCGFTSPARRTAPPVVRYDPKTGVTVEVVPQRSEQ